MWFRSDFLWALTLAGAAFYRVMGGPGRLSLASEILVIKEPHINAISVLRRIQIWSAHSSAEACVGEHRTQR